MRHPRTLRRALLATLAAVTVALPAAAPGCTAGFAPVSQLTGLRVLAVVADEPYAQPGDTVTFAMTYDDTYDRPPPEILWLGGCYDPEGDDYYNCYTSLGLADLNPESPPPGVVLGSGTTFSLTLPSDLITRRPKPSSGPYYGLAYVFFLACAGGHIAPVAAQGTGLAGSFPVGCLDSAGNQLGADSFVPGYTQVYAFAEGWTNANPLFSGDGLALDDAGIPDGPSGIPVVEGCAVPEDTRQATPGCGAKDPFSVCPSYNLTVEVPANVAEIDPSTTGPDGQPVHETVWVDYFADNGDIQVPTLLVSDALTGIEPAASYTTAWIGPPDAGPVHVWAVLHDSRGGEAVLEKTLMVAVSGDGDGGAP